MAAQARLHATLQSTLEIVVLHTTTKETLTALKTAATLAQGLSAQIRLLVIQTVPYPLPLDHPSVPLSFTRRRFCTLAEHAAIETSVDIQLVRDVLDNIGRLLPPNSVVVVGVHRTWWPSATKKFARRLEALGHQVVYAE